MTPPLRFLAFVLGGWALARAALLALPEPAPGLVPRSDAKAVVVLTRGEKRPDGIMAATLQTVMRVPRHPPLAEVGRKTSSNPIPSLRAQRSNPPPENQGGLRLANPAPAPFALALPQAAAPREHRTPLASPPLPRPTLAPRWSFSAWALARRGDAPGLAAAGTLGGSQAGMRALYRLGPRLSAAARLSTGLSAPAGGEAALGLEWQPLPRLPVRLLAERREALGGEGRSGFALLAHGGVSEAPLGAFRLDAYGQAGAVGLRRPALFADGAARLSLPLGARVRVGAGAWAAAQPGAARLDLGPTASWRLPAADARLTLDWRIRAAGDARPGSGPALTLAADF